MATQPIQNKLNSKGNMDSNMRAQIIGFLSITERGAGGRARAALVLQGFQAVGSLSAARLSGVLMA